jgi:hypothetical protein
MRPSTSLFNDELIICASVRAYLATQSTCTIQKYQGQAHSADLESWRWIGLESSEPSPIKIRWALDPPKTMHTIFTRLYKVFPSNSPVIVPIFIQLLVSRFQHVVSKYSPLNR